MAIKFLIAVTLLFPALAYADDKPCGPDLEKQIVVGQQPTAGTLYTHIQHVEMGAVDKDFWDETFTYIGDAHTKSGVTYKIGFLEVIWGQSCRATQRLFIFDKDNKYLGQYYGIEVDAKDIKISGAVLHFPFDANDGNTLDLENGPPKQAWLDGDNPRWYPAQ